MARLSGRPLLDTRADAALYVDRAAELARLSWSVDEGLNALVAGDPGSGKTSLLRRLQADLRTSLGTGGRVVFLDLAGVEGAVDALGRLLEAVAPPRPDGAPDPAYDTSSVAEVLARLEAVAPPGRLVVLADGLPIDLAHPLFGQLRDELWRLPACWVVTCPAAAESTFRRPPADAFFEAVLRLEPLSEDVLMKLLRARVGVDELDDDHLRAAAQLAAGNPRRAVELVRHLLAAPDGEASTVVPELRRHIVDRGEALYRLGRPATMLMAELEALGSASASDERLLDRLGWTRGRAAQVFALLETAGLVEASAQRNGAGRPRKVFRPTGTMPG